MKRYLCEKNVFVDEHRTPAFKAGKPYPMTELKYQNEFTDEFGNVWIVTDQLLDNFRHLPDLPLVDHPDYVIPVTEPSGKLIMEDGSGFFRGCIIWTSVIFMVAITLIALFW